MSHRKINGHLLECLSVLVDEGHVTRAANRLNTTQPKLSAILARLRTMTGDPLLVPTSNGMVPTELALQLAAESRGFIERWNLLIEQGSRFDPQQSRRTFNIRTADVATQHILIKAAHRIQKIAPMVAISVTNPMATSFRDALETGQTDLAIGWNPQLPSDFLISRLTTFKVICLVSAQHPRIGSEVSLDQFLAERHVQVTYGDKDNPLIYEKEVDRLLAEHGHKRDIAFYLPSLRLVPEIVARTDLVSLVSEALGQWGQRHYPVKILPVPIALPTHEISMIWHARRKNDPGLKWLRDVIRDSVDIGVDDALDVPVSVDLG